ncbi:MAG: hypothetical protein V4819_21280 [Verrucomicrobiota bacterium]
MKNRLILLSCGTAVFAMFAVSYGQVTAPSKSGGDGRALSEFPMNLKCIITLDARSNSRSTMTQEMQVLGGFVRHDTVQGTLVRVNSEWLVLKDGDSENWVPRDKVLLVRTNP